MVVCYSHYGSGKSSSFTQFRYYSGYSGKPSAESKEENDVFGECSHCRLHRELVIRGQGQKTVGEWCGGPGGQATYMGWRLQSWKAWMDDHTHHRSGLATCLIRPRESRRRESQMVPGVGSTERTDKDLTESRLVRELGWSREPR